MRKVFLFLTLLLISPHVLAQSSGRYYEQEVERKQVVRKADPRLCGGSENPLTVAGFVNYPPFGWVESRVGMGGMEIQQNFGLGMAVFDKIAKKYNISYVHRPFLNYKEAQKALQDGRVDVLLETYYDSPTTGSVGQFFYPAYINNPFVVVTLKGNLKNIKSFEDLKGKKGVVRWEEMIMPLIRPTLPKDIKIEMVSGARNAFRKLIKRDVDFILMSDYALETESRRFKIKDFIEKSSFVVRSPNIFFNFTKRRGCAARMQKAFEREIRALVEDKAELRRLLSAQITYWENKFKDEPSMLLAEGFNLEDEMALEIQMDKEEEERLRRLENLDTDVLIKEQEDKNKREAPTDRIGD